MKIPVTLLFLAVSLLSRAQGLPSDSLIALTQRYAELLPDPAPDPALRQASIVGKLYKITDKYPGGALASIRYAKELPLARSFPEIGAVSVFYPDGTLKESRNPEGEGYRVKEFFASGQVFREYLLQQGEKEMIAVFDPEGKPLITEGRGNALEMFRHGDKAVLETGSYTGGKRDGEWLGYTDRLFYREVHKAGRLVSGESWDASGRKFTYKMREEPASFKGGEQKWFDYLARNLQLPSDVSDEPVRVATGLEIDSTGKVLTVQLMNEAPPASAAEALRVMRSTSGQWLPSKLCGQPVSAFYTQIISFNLR